MARKTVKPEKPPAGPDAGNSQKNSRAAHLAPFNFKPGQSGNLAGRPQGDAVMRKRLMKSFLANEKEAMAAMARRWANVKYVQDMWELLARLEGELSKDAGEGGRGVAVIVLQNNGDRPLDPEVFRASALGRGTPAGLTPNPE